MTEYIPTKGDIVWIDFDPSTGKEIKKRRPTLVVSQKTLMIEPNLLWFVQSLRQ